MLQAELHGKVRGDLRPLIENSEDLLTSQVMGLLRYLPEEDGLFALLRQARRVEAGAVRHDEGWLPLTGAARCAVHLWQRDAEHGEPDVLLEIKTAADKLLHLVVIEAKLWSNKSGAGATVESPADDDQADGGDEADADELAPVLVKDQLVRYWRLLEKRAAGRRIQPDRDVTLIYLTAHNSPPLAELRESLQIVPSMRLGWLGWHDVHRLAVRLAAARPELLVAHDLRDFLAHRGFGDFGGFLRAKQQLPLPSPVRHSFWRVQQNTWFRQPPVTLPSTGRYWSAP